MGLIRLVLFGFVGLSIIYLCLSLYSKSVRKERLENEYDAAPVEGQSRDEYVTTGMRAYNSGLRPKLLALVYVVPTVLVSVIVYVTNAN